MYTKQNEKKWKPSFNDYLIHFGMVINILVILTILYYYFFHS
jgi:hypothetical protein